MRTLARWRSRRPTRLLRLTQFACLVAAFGLSLSCGGSPSGPTPAAGGGSSGSLDAAYALVRQQSNVTSLVVSRNGAIERQEYFNGGGPDTPQDVRSVTKSVVSLLVGVALDRGCIRSVDQPVAELLAGLGPADPAKAPITVRHLLTMTSGLGNDELLDVTEFNRWVNAPNQLEYLWALPIQAPAGTRFTYFSAAFHPLSPILTVSCGRPTSDFARDLLFAPLGIGTRPWATDRQGFANGAAGLQLTPRDMVAIGNLVLDGGSAGGRQVVSSTWIAEATRVQVGTASQPYATGYGYGWWVGQASGAGVIFANGYGGQFIVVVPRSRLVVTATARWQSVDGSAANAQWRAIIGIIMDRIVPLY